MTATHRLAPAGLPESLRMPADVGHVFSLPPLVWNNYRSSALYR